MDEQTLRLIKAEAEIARLREENERLKSQNLCGVCGGVPPISGLPCVCGGTGRACDEAQHARELFVALEAENERLRSDQSDWRKGVELIASALEKDPPDFSCSRIAEVALSIRAENERLSLDNFCLSRPIVKRIQEAETKVVALEAELEQRNKIIKNGRLNAEADLIKIAALEAENERLKTALNEWETQTYSKNDVAWTAARQRIAALETENATLKKFLGFARFNKAKIEFEKRLILERAYKNWDTQTCNYTFGKVLKWFNETINAEAEKEPKP